MHKVLHIRTLVEFKYQLVYTVFMISRCGCNIVEQNVCDKRQMDQRLCKIGRLTELREKNGYLRQAF